MSTTKSKRSSKRARAEERRRIARRKQLMTRAVIGVGVVLIAVVFVFAFSSSETAVGTTETDAWDLPALDGGETRVTLDQFSGKPTVAAFFASWCEVCRQELPGFAELSLRLGEDVDFVGINTMNNGSGLPFAHRLGIGDWPLARDVGGIDGRQLATNFGARGSPTTVIYDADGVVVDVTLGRLTAGQLAQRLDQFFGVGS
ncbi:MAG: TlpA disulfide reductase family protein [Actinomycetota bacterium]|nr:TlpA disulfide reductase family protein [Actinomycetota bacterium]